MKLYDSVIIFGQVVKVSYSDKVPDNENANYINGEILIHPKCPKKELDRVFLHEVIHSICERVSISQGISAETEEIIVDAISKALTENFTMKFKKSK